MNDQNIATALQLLEALGKKLGTTGEYLWGVLLRQAAIFGWMMAGFYLLAAIGSPLLLIKTYRFWQRTAIQARQNHEFTPDFPIALFTGSLMLVSSFMFFLLIEINSTLAALFNPEFWAFQEVLSLINGPGSCR